MAAGASTLESTRVPVTGAARFPLETVALMVCGEVAELETE